MNLRLLLISVALFCMNSIYGQETVQIPIQELNTSWREFYSTENFSISVRYADCSDEYNGVYKDYYLLRLENKTKKTVLIDWHYKVYYNDVCKSCNDPDNEFLFRYELSPEEILEPDCGSFNINPPYQLSVFRSILNHPELPQLTKAEIDNLTLYIY